MKRPTFDYRHAARWLVSPLEYAVVSRLPLPAAVAHTPTPPAVVLTVARSKNATLVRALCEQAAAAGAQCLVWALDAPIDGLADITVGQGPGSRTDLLNRLYAKADIGPDTYVVLADDDVELVVSDLATLLRLCLLAGLSLAQPSHIRASHAAFGFVLGKRSSVVRATTVIECGPMVVVSPAFRDRVMPLPDDFGMGWGLELVWHQARREDERFGQVDAVRQRHHGRIGRDYPHTVELEIQRFVAIREAAGLSGDLPSLQRVLGVWHRRRAAPPWDVPGSATTDAARP